MIDVLASAIVWHSTGDLGAGSKLLAALNDPDREFSLLAECVQTSAHCWRAVRVRGTRSRCVPWSLAPRFRACFRRMPFAVLDDNNFLCC
jgi:hypothetical protein